MTPKETSKEVIDELCKILDASPKKYRETMTPKEKAKDLYDSYWYCLLQSNIEKRNYWSQQSALIAVDEILEVLYSLKLGNALSEELEYWEEVKQEIEKL